MTEENGGLSDDELSGIFDDVLNETIPESTDPVEDPSDTSDTTSTPEPQPQPEPEPDPDPVPLQVSPVERVLAVIKDGDGSDLRAFDSQVSDDLDSIAASDDESQMLVITLCHQKNPSDKLAVRTLAGLAFRRSQLKREGKRVDYANLNTQVRSCLAGKLAWDDIEPVEYVPEPKTDVDPDMVEAGELAAALKCAVVDVLALADLKTGDAKTMVSRAKVTAALNALPTPADEPDNDKPPLFDYEEPGNQPGDGEDEQVDVPVVVVKVPAPPVDQKTDDDPTPITGYEYITVDHDDQLSELDDDWYVKNCRSLVELLDS